MTKKNPDKIDSRIWLVHEVIGIDPVKSRLELVQKFPHQRIHEAQKALRKDPPEPGTYRLIRLFDEVMVKDVTARKVKFS